MAVTSINLGNFSLFLAQIIPTIRVTEIVKCPINCTTLRNDDVIVTSLKNAVSTRREMPEFILVLLWPPNSVDLNLVDYSVWGILQDKVHKTCMTDLGDFKQRIRTEWAKLEC